MPPIRRTMSHDPRHGHERQDVRTTARTPAFFGTLRVALRDLRDHRQLLVVIVQRDLRVRYKQAVIGAGWAVIAPFFSMLIFALVFSRAVGIETEVPYPLFAYSGLLVWGLLASSLRSATTSLTGNHALVTKVRFPRAVLPLSAIVVAFVDFLVAALLLAGMMLFYGIRPGPTIVLLPLVLAVEVALITGLGLLLALGNLYYRDVGLVFGLFLGLWMFLTSVVYPVSLIGGRAGALLLVLNPMNPIIEAYRATLFDLPIPSVGGLLFSALIAALVLASAVSWFHHLESRFAEAI